MARQEALYNEGTSSSKAITYVLGELTSFSLS